MAPPNNFRLRLTNLNINISATVSVTSTGDEYIETEASRPAPAQQTSGPHRYTILAPHTDASKVNIGMASPHIPDTGITGQTTSHIHWHTVGNPDGRTSMLLLGGSTNRGFAGFDGNVLGRAEGYAMVTQGKGWHDVKQKSGFISREGDLMIHAAAAGKRAVLQAPQGTVDIVAGQQAQIVSKGMIAISAQSAADTSESPQYDNPWVGKAGQTKVPADNKTALDAVAFAFSLLDLATKAPKMIKAPTSGWNKWEVESRAQDIAKLIADGYKAIDSAKSLAEDFGWVEGSPPGASVKIGAEKKISMVAGAKISAYGAEGISFTSARFASLGAGLSTSVKGVLWAGVTSMWTSIKGYRKVGVEAQFGKASLGGKQGVSIESSDGTTKAKGKTGVEVTSDAHAAVAGGTMFYGGAGTGAGFGFLAKTSEARFGKITSDANKLTSPSFDKEKSFWVNEREAVMRYGGAIIQCKDGAVNVKSGNGAAELKIEQGGKVSWSATLIELG